MSLGPEESAKQSHCESNLGAPLLPGPHAPTSEPRAQLCKASSWTFCWPRGFRAAALSATLLGAALVAIVASPPRATIRGAGSLDGVVWLVGAAGPSEQEHAAQSTTSHGVFSSWPFHLFVIMLACITISFVLQWLLCWAVVQAIRRFDEKFAGVTIDLGTMMVSLCRGRVTITGCTVHNPAGYKGDHMMKIDHFTFDVGICRTLKTLGREIQVEEIRMEGVEADLEFAGMIVGKSNVHTVLDHMGKSMPSRRLLPMAPVEPVYAFWNRRRRKHTFHFAPAWVGEEMLDIQFFAFSKEMPGTEPVHDFWHNWHREHTFHLGGPWGGEEQRHVQFYVYPDEVPNAEPVYNFWNDTLREHTCHFGEPWNGEVKQPKALFYALQRDPTGLSLLTRQKRKGKLKPVYDFFHLGNMEHTFHFAPAWRGERRGKVQFYARDAPCHGAEPVYGFWNATRGEHTVHMGDPWTGETKGDILFYAYSSQHLGTEPVHLFFNDKLRQHTVHFGEPWGHESKGDVVFYAHRSDPKDKFKLVDKAKLTSVFTRALLDSEIIVEKVLVTGIKVKVETHLASINVHVEPIKHDNFSSDFGTHGIKDVIYCLVKDVVSHISITALSEGAVGGAFKTIGGYAGGCMPSFKS